MYSTKISIERKTLILATVLFFNLTLISLNVPLKNKKSVFQNTISTIVSPFQIGFQKIFDFISKEIKHYVFLKNSFEKYTDIKKKHDKLMYENYCLRKKIVELGFLSEAKKKYKNFIKLDIISIDKNFPFNSLIANKGSKHGIKKDMVVLNLNGELVGKVVEPISYLSSNVRLITSPIGGVGAYIKNNKLEGLLIGNNNATCNFRYLIQNKPVNIGDIIITSGTDKIFPPYIPIGKVINIKKEYLIQQVFVKPFFIEKSIKQLILIKNE